MTKAQHTASGGAQRRRCAPSLLLRRARGRWCVSLPRFKFRWISSLVAFLLCRLVYANFSCINRFMMEWFRDIRSVVASADAPVPKRMRFVGPTQCGCAMFVFVTLLYWQLPAWREDLAKSFDGAATHILIWLTAFKTLFPGYHRPRGTVEAKQSILGYHNSICVSFFVLFTMLHGGIFYRQFFVLQQATQRVAPWAIVLSAVLYGIFVLQSFCFCCGANLPLSNLWFMDDSESSEMELVSHDLLTLSSQTTKPGPRTSRRARGGGVP